MSERIIESEFESKRCLKNNFEIKSDFKETFESKTGFKETVTRQKSSYTIEDILKKRQTSDNTSTPTQTQVYLCLSIHLIVRAGIPQAHRSLCLHDFIDKC